MLDLDTAFLRRAAAGVSASEGRPHVAAVIDTFSHRVVGGWSMSAAMTSSGGVHIPLPCLQLVQSGKLWTWQRRKGPSHEAIAGRIAGL